jgi:choline dehydrogenase
MHRPNLTVLTHAHAKRIVFEGKRAVGVEFLRGNAAQVARASAEVILAAGSIGSVQLLELSGVGSPSVLQPLGIPVLHALEGVGGNLQDHLQMRMAFKVKNTVTLNTRANSLFGKAWMGIEYALFKRGPLTMAPSQLGAFTRSDPTRETPNLQYHVQPLSLNKFGEPLHPFPAFTASVCNLRPTSRGTIHITSPDFRQAPTIKPNYLATDEDRKVAVDAIRLTRRIVGSEALTPFEPEEFMPGPHVQSDEDLAKAAGDIGTTIFHPVGTCKMGVDDLAVVDSRLRVRGLRGLRVVDASVMPTITSGNTAAPTLMISEKGSRMILEDRRAGAV